MPVKLSKETRNTDLYAQDPKVVVPELLTSLRVGMCEAEVFSILGISHDTSNLVNLSVEDVYQHVSLLHIQNDKTYSCAKSHDAELPYVGHRLLFSEIRNTGYFKGIMWFRKSSGSDWHVDLLFYRDAFISYAVGGELNRDVRKATYPWEGILGDPFGRISKPKVP